MAGEQYWTIAQMAEALRDRTISPVELTRLHLDRIARLDPVLNSWITVTADAALAEAALAERAIALGRWRGTLHGVPLGLKDLFETKGVRTTGGSRVLWGNVPDRDAFVVEQLRAAGAILLGKHNLHEFGRGVTNENPHFGPARNPWDPARIPGGSSGGSAAAVAAGMCAGALGTDTGGSLRIPPALCGVVGLKPTYGRVSRRGMLELSWTLDHAGPIGRTVADARALLEAIDSFDTEGDSQPVPSQESRGGTVRAGVLMNATRMPMDAEVRQAFQAAVKALESLGIEAFEVELPEMERIWEVVRTIANSEATEVHAQWLVDKPHGYGADVLERLEAGRKLTAVEYAHAFRRRREVMAAVQRLFARVDVILSPTTCFTAPRIGHSTELLNGAEIDVMGQLSATTNVYNVAGNPAVTLPCGFNRAGLPIGLQIAAAPWQDALALDVAERYERATNWHLRRPPEPAP